MNQSVINNLAAKINSKEQKSNKVTSLSSSSTDTQYPSAKAVYDALSEAAASNEGNYIYDFYLDSSNDDIVLEYDSASGGGSGDGGSSVDIITNWGQTLSDEKVPSEKLVKNSLDSKAESSSLSTVATSGSYNDLSNKPTIQDILGSAYYNYKLELSNHNPKTGDTITVTCKVTNIFNTPIPQKSVELFLNETSQGTETTDVYGVATWSITLGATRSALFRVENAYAYVNYNSWKLVETKESGKVKVYVMDNMVALSIQDSFTLTANGSTTIATISSQYAPNYQLTTNFHPTAHNIKAMIYTGGTIIVYNNSSETSGNARIYVTYPLKARMP